MISAEASLCETRAMLPNFVLIGFMGCGKSSVGRKLSSLTGHRFVDTDELVVKAEGRSIPEIFAACGEEGFREIEQRVLADLVGVAGEEFAGPGLQALQAGRGAKVPEVGRQNKLVAQGQGRGDGQPHAHSAPGTEKLALGGDDGDEEGDWEEAASPRRQRTHFISKWRQWFDDVDLQVRRVQPACATLGHFSGSL